MPDKLTKDLLESARQFARVGLDAASSAVGYAVNVLRDVEKELKVSSERLADTRPAAGPAEPQKP